MPISSLKKSNFMSALPEYWNEEDKTNYELLVADAKRYFPYMDEYVVHIGVVAEINRQLGRREEAKEEDVKNLMEKYKDTTIEYITPYDPDFDFNSTMVDLLQDQKKCDSIIEEEENNEIVQSC